MTQPNTLPVLVTGASGYLGQQLVAELLGRGVPVLRTGRRASPDIDVVADLSDPNVVPSAFEDIRLSHIIHTAAVVPSDLAGYADETASRESVKIAGSIARLAQTKNVPVTLISSMTVYPADALNPVNENDAGGQPSSTYAKGKLEAEHVFQNAGVSGFAVRIPGLFGGVRDRGIVAGIKNALNNNIQPTLPTDPLQWAAMHVDDAARAIVQLCLSAANGYQPVNVGYSGPISITHLTKIAASVFDQPVDNPVVHPIFEYDLSRWKQLTGTTPKAFKDALQEYFR